MAVPDLSTIKLGRNTDLSRYLVFAPSVGAIAISILIAIFVVWPKFNETLRLRSSNEQLTVQAQSLNSKVADLEALSLQQDALESQLGAADQLLPSNKSAFTLIQQVERAAGESGVLLTKLDTAPGLVSSQDSGTDPSAALTVPDKVVPTFQNQATISDAASGVPKLELSIALTSDYKSFLQFMSKTLSISRVVSIDNLSVASIFDSNGVRASMTIVSYWKPLPARLNSIETPIELLTAEEVETLEQVALEGSINVPPPPQVPTGKSDLFTPF